MTAKGEYVIDGFLRSATFYRRFEEAFLTMKPDAASGLWAETQSQLQELFLRIDADDAFWTMLEEAKEPLAANASQIENAHLDVEGFLAAEDEIFRTLGLDAVFSILIQTQLSISVRSNRPIPYDDLPVMLREGISVALNAVQSVPKDLNVSSRTEFMKAVRKMRSAIGIAGGVATIVVNTLQTHVNPFAWVSIVMGVKNVLDVVDLLKTGGDAP